MRNTVIFLALLAFASCTRNCERKGKHSKVTYTNNSNRNIKYMIVDNYPDEQLPGKYGNQSHGNDLTAYSTYVETMDSKYKCVETNFRNGRTYWVYFYDTDTLKMNGYSYTDSYHNPLLERRAVDLNYLQQHDFILTYNE